ncbi:hypothetical protein [Flavobacterium gawalongense]|uniref:hypothetical protein n=1 Tax=Flavobacterium gawalongense TaxID=2594432 RepID=UPI00163DABC6|nr:hypothetical protein [Flavobacterium gawalongense]
MIGKKGQVATCPYLGEIVRVFGRFFGAVSCSTLYLFLLKESKKRMPLQSGLGI